MMPSSHRGAAVAASVLTLLAHIAAAGAAAAEYRFEVVGVPEASASGKSIVTLRLTHIPDGKPVAGAIVIQTHADMSPEKMKDMTAPVKALPATDPGLYRFEIEPGMAGGWALTVAAKVQGEAETVRGDVTVKLAK